MGGLKISLTADKHGAIAAGDKEGRSSSAMAAEELAHFEQRSRNALAIGEYMESSEF